MYGSIGCGLFYSTTALHSSLNEGCGAGRTGERTGVGSDSSKHGLAPPASLELTTHSFVELLILPLCPLLVPSQDLMTTYDAMIIIRVTESCHEVLTVRPLINLLPVVIPRELTRLTHLTVQRSPLSSVE
jgi:hypothetical protein